MAKINIIPIFVPHLGCPNDCVFCNQKRITGVNNFDINSVSKTIEDYLSYFSPTSPRQIAFYGGSFTAIEEDLQKKLLSIAKTYKDRGLVDGIRLSTRPDCIDKHVLTYLKAYGVDTIELGIQSTNTKVLNLSKRGHDRSSIFYASKLIKEAGFKLGLQQMLGLPGDCQYYSIETCNETIELQPDFVRIYPTLVIKNTELELMYLNGTYKPLTLDEAVDLASKLIMLYENSNIEIIRVGLQATENLKFDKDVVAGPLHDAFRELCESKKLYNVLEAAELNIRENENISLYSNARNNALLVGQKGSNKENIKKLFKTDKIKFKVDTTLSDQIKVVADKTYLIDIRENIKNIVKGW